MKKIREAIEKIIPMSLGSLVLFLFVLYLLFVVTKSLIDNYESNKQIDAEEQKLTAMEADITTLKNVIAYEQTATYKEREAREKLGYIAPGESVIILPLDKPEEQGADSGLADAKVIKPNYILWWEYFLGSN